MPKAKSRSERFQEALATVSIGKADIESLRDELQEWLDNMPENLQGGTKAEELEEAIGSLEEVIEHLEEAEGTEINFPGMY
jgi:uncharacterized protein YgfB (UPF0149 family)